MFCTKWTFHPSNLFSIISSFIIIENLLVVKLFFTKILFFFRRHLHQNNIISNLTNAPQINDILLLFSKNPHEFTIFRDDNVGNAALTQIKDHVFHKPNPFPVTHINYFFLSQFTDTHRGTSFLFINLIHNRNISFNLWQTKNTKEVRARQWHNTKLKSVE